MSDDNFHIDDSKSNNNNAMNQSVHIHDEYQMIPSYYMDIHLAVYILFDHYYNYRLIME
jgi:hypothetical protein